MAQLDGVKVLKLARDISVPSKSLKNAHDSSYIMPLISATNHQKMFNTRELKTIDVPIDLIVQTTVFSAVLSLDYLDREVTWS